MPGPRTTPTVLGPLRRPAPVVAAVALLLATALGVWYAGDPVAGNVDRRTESVVDAVTGGHGRFVVQLVWLGSPRSVVFWAVLLALVALALLRRRHAVLAIVAPGLTGLATTALKPVFGRTLGDYAGYSYPSGHTGGATSIALVVALLLVGLAPTRRAVAVAVVACAALFAGGVVGTGMVSIGAHYPTDAVGGFCLAVAIGLGTGLVIDRVADRRAARTGPPIAPAER